MKNPRIYLFRILVRILLDLNHALIRLAQLMVPPQLTLLDHVGGVSSTQMIYVAAHLKIADLLVSGPKSAEEIAASLKLNPDATFRIMRALVTLGVFKFSRNGAFRNNRLSKVLISDSKGGLRDFADYFGSQTNMGAWSDLLTTVRTGSNAFERVHKMSIWSWFKRYPNDGEIFARAMMNLTQLDAAILAQAYPFHEIQKLCDVAGGRGTLLAEILERHPHLKAVLYDEEYVLEEARVYLASKGLESRVDRKSGSFFEGIPGACDAYLIKDILHDWDDERCIQILRQVRNTLDAGGRLLVVEVLVGLLTARKPGPLMDVHMMTVCCEGRQRSKEDLRLLFEKSGFRMGRIFSTPSPMSVIEGIVDSSWGDASKNEQKYK